MTFEQIDACIRLGVKVYKKYSTRPLQSLRPPRPHIRNGQYRHGGMQGRENWCLCYGYYGGNEIWGEEFPSLELLVGFYGGPSRFTTLEQRKRKVKTLTK